MSLGGPVPCRSPSCRKLVDFAVPEPGEGRALMPVDHDSAGDPAGNLEVWRDAGGVLRYRVLGKDEEPAPGRRRGTSHFATCPEPGVWRKAGRRR